MQNLIVPNRERSKVNEVSEGLKTRAQAGNEMCTTPHPIN